MATSDNETFQQLLEEIKKLNKNLETASSAIKIMTNQLSLAPAILHSNPQPEANGDISEPSNLDTAPNVSVGKETSRRTLGYVNWNSSHDVLKSQRLYEMSLIRESLEKMLEPMPSQNGQNCNNRAITYGTNVSNNNTNKNYSGFFKFNLVAMKVDPETRFPQNAVYVDVESPKVKMEIEFMNKVTVQPTLGIIERFQKIVESEMQTCATFEKLHGLKWV